MIFFANLFDLTQIYAKLREYNEIPANRGLLQITTEPEGHLPLAQWRITPHLSEVLQETVASYHSPHVQEYDNAKRSNLCKVRIS